MGRSRDVPFDKRDGPTELHRLCGCIGARDILRFGEVDALPPAGIARHGIASLSATCRLRPRRRRHRQRVPFRDGCEAEATLAAAHGVDPVAASLQFARTPDVAAALIVGAATPGHVPADHAALRAGIPAAFWAELRVEGGLHPDAQVPA